MLKLRQPLPCRRSLGYLVKVMLHFSFKSALLVNVFLPLPICRGLERREIPAASEQKTQALHDETPPGAPRNGSRFYEEVKSPVGR